MESHGVIVAFQASRFVILNAYIFCHF